MMINEYFYVKRYSCFLSSFYSYRANFSRCVVVIFFILHFGGVVFAQVQKRDTSIRDETGTTRNRITRFFNHQAQVRYIYQVMINPAATSVVWSADGPEGSQAIYRSPLSNADSNIRITATTGLDQFCSETEAQWSPDGREVAFLSDARSRGQAQIFISSAATGALVNAQPLTHFDGYVSHLKWSPDGKYISVLYVEKARREPSPMAAENKAVGLIDSTFNKDVQRIAILNRFTGEVQEVTPPNFYIFEYDWSPDSKKFVYTTAAPPGDDNWYIARLYQQSVDATDTLFLYKPSWQIALPRWAPDGKRIAFIEGLMSDQGGTGGEIFVMSVMPETQATKFNA